MDNRLQDALRAARTENTLESWVRVAHLAEASNTCVEECVPPIVSARGAWEDDICWHLEDLVHVPVSKGDLVTFANPRARAKFKSGGKVEVGTEGVVIWVGENQWGVKVGVKTEDGEVFFTNPANVERRVFATYLARSAVRHHVDKHWPGEREFFMSYPRRVKGKSVRTADAVGVIFWSKWQGSELRVGFKKGRGGEAHWASITECEPA